MYKTINLEIHDGPGSHSHMQNMTGLHMFMDAQSFPNLGQWGSNTTYKQTINYIHESV